MAGQTDYNYHTTIHNKKEWNVDTIWMDLKGNRLNDTWQSFIQELHSVWSHVKNILEITNYSAWEQISGC